MTFSLRQASVADLHTLATLFDGYRQFYYQAPDLAGARAFMLGRLQAGDSIIYLAVDEAGEGAGFVQLYPAYSSVRMQRVYLLNDLYVAPTHRRQGLARQLMRRAQQLMQDSGAAYLALETGVENKQAQALYEAEGYVRCTDSHFYFLYRA